MAPDDISTLRVLSLNLALAPNPWSCYGDERIAFLLDRLSQFDILVFQEAFKGFFGLNAHSVNVLEHALEQRGFHWHVHGPQDSSTTGGDMSCCVDGGLAIYSRFPATHASTHMFDRGVHVDWLAAKGAVHLKVEVSAGRFVHVVTSHLQASYSGELDFYPGIRTRTYLAVRQAQVKELKAVIARVAGDDGAPVLFCGDLNADAILWDQEKKLHGTAQAQAQAQAQTQKQRRTDTPTRQQHDECEFGRHLECLGDALHGRTLVDVIGRDFSSVGVRPPTFGDLLPDGTPAETVLTPADEQGVETCVDAVLFWAAALDSSGVAFRPVKGTCSTEAFEVPGGNVVPGTPCKRASDHLGWSFTCTFQGHKNDEASHDETRRKREESRGLSAAPVFRSRGSILCRRAVAGAMGAHGGQVALFLWCVVAWLFFVLPRSGTVASTFVASAGLGVGGVGGVGLLVVHSIAAMLDLAVHVAAVAVHLLATVLTLAIVCYDPPLDSTLVYALPTSAATAVLGGVVLAS